MARTCTWAVAEAAFATSLDAEEASSAAKSPGRGRGCTRVALSKVSMQLAFQLSFSPPANVASKQQVG